MPRGISSKVLFHSPKVSSWSALRISGIYSSFWFKGPQTVKHRSHQVVAHSDLHGSSSDGACLLSLCILEAVKQSFNTKTVIYGAPVLIVSQERTGGRFSQAWSLGESCTHSHDVDERRFSSLRPPCQAPVKREAWRQIAIQDLFRTPASLYCSGTCFRTVSRVTTADASASKTTAQQLSNAMAPRRCSERTTFEYVTCKCCSSTVKVRTGVPKRDVIGMSGNHTSRSSSPSQQSSV
jgi:hypothetical protein